MYLFIRGHVHKLLPRKSRHMFMDYHIMRKLSTTTTTVQLHMYYQESIWVATV